MKQQIFVVNGGSTFDSPEEYLINLKTKVVSLDRLRTTGWKINLRVTLGENYDVLIPTMPNTGNAKYSEWKIWFEKFIPLLDEDIVFVSHSLGGIFLAKYLSEEGYPKKIKATILVAPPAFPLVGETLTDFVLGDDLSKLSTQGGRIIIYQSRDDQTVPFSNMEWYQDKLQNAEFKVFEDRGHFNQEVFLELIQDIKGLE